MTRVLLGTGQLSWHRGERVTDRYGSIGLFVNHLNDTIELPLAIANEGRTGKLIAIVTETRKSRHVGDILAGHSPSTPEVGEEIVLGEGTLFTERYDSYFYLGLKPDDGREYNWLDTKMLYRAHEQSVELWFEEAR